VRRQKQQRVDNLLDSLRVERQHQVDLALLGAQLRKLGVPETMGRRLIADMRDAQRRPHVDDDGRWHPGFRVEIDDEDPRGSIDFEVMACWYDDELRYDAHLAAHRSRKTPLLPRISDDEAAYVDELCVMPQVAALFVEILEDGGAVEPILDEGGVVL
jgi:hypothetical protein